MHACRFASLLAVLVLCLAGCSETAKLTIADGMGPEPKLPEPRKTLIPTIKVAPAKSWPTGAKPTAATGLSVAAFANGLDHPRWLYVLPNGDVLVAETNAPPKPQDGRHQRLVHETRAEESWLGRAERESHHFAARRGR